MKRLVTIVAAIVLCLPTLASTHFHREAKPASSRIPSQESNSQSMRHLQERLPIYMAARAGVLGSSGRNRTGLAMWTPGEEFMTAALGDTTEPDKEQVKKKDKKEKGAATQTDKGDDDGSCFGECLGGFFLTLCSDDDDEPSEVAPVGYVAVPVAPASPFPFDALVAPQNPQSDSVTVWNNPGGRAAEASIVGSAGRGEKVTVTERAFYGPARWLRIVTREPSSTVGWIQASDVAGGSAGPGDQPLAPSAVVTNEPYVDVTTRNWDILLDLGVPFFTDDKLHAEYSKYSGHGWAGSVGVTTRLFMVHALQVNAGVSYMLSDGVPQYDYVIGSTTESPTDSELEVWSFRVGFGQAYPLTSGGGGFFLWEVSPSVFYVEESADIDIVENKVVTGTRTDELSEWKGGLQARIEIGGGLRPVFISLHSSFSIFPWHSNYEKSLTLDFLEENYIDFFEVGVTIGYGFFSD